MRMTIDTSDVERLQRGLSQFSDRRFRAAMAEALFIAGRAVQRAEVAEIRDVFDRPTPFTTRQVFLRRGNADRPEVEVGVSDYPYTEGYLKPHVLGGPRRHKRFERALIAGGAMRRSDYAVPGRFARLDAYGNISAGQIRQILSQLRIEPTTGATSALPRILAADNLKTQRAKQRRINSAYRRAGGQFVAFPDGRGKLVPGIYQVRATAFGRTDPRPVMVFLPGMARYDAERFDFYYVAEQAARRSLTPAVAQAIDNHVRRLAAKGAA